MQIRSLSGALYYILRLMILYLVSQIVIVLQPICIKLFSRCFNSGEDKASWKRNEDSSDHLYPGDVSIYIQSDLFWHRCLERQTFGTPRMYTLSLSKGIKRSNYGEFLIVKNVLFMYTMYYRQQRDNLRDKVQNH
jgi:hypothetical protein